MSNYAYQPLVTSGVNDYNSVFAYTNGKQPAKNERLYEDFSISMPTKYADPKQACFDCICTSVLKFFCYLAFILTFPLSGIVCLKLCHQFERFVVYRLGRLQGVKGPGVVLVLPCIDTWNRIDLRTKAFNIPPTKLRTQDGCIISVGGVVHFAVQNPVLMTSSIQDMNHSVRVISQSSMTNLLCKKNIQDIMSSRGKYNFDLQVDINLVAKNWGIEINRVELSQVTVEFTPNGKSNAQPSMAPMPSSDNISMDTLAKLAQQFLSSSPEKQQSAGTQDSAVINLKLFSDTTSIMNAVKQSLSQELVNEINATYEITIEDQDETFYIDLKNGSGDCGLGKFVNGEPDVKFEMNFATLEKFINGQLKPFDAYWKGQLKVSGDKDKAQEIEKLANAVKLCTTNN